MTASIIPPFKTCTKCGEEKPATLEYFYKHPQKRDGLTPRCRDCHARARGCIPFSEREILPEVSEGYKRCSKCKQEKPATPEYFNKKAMARDGLHSWCLECRGMYACERYASDVEYREKLLARTSEYEARPESRKKKRARERERYTNNPEVRQKKKATNHRRRAAEGTYSPEDVQSQYKSQRGKCWHCGVSVGDDYHVDHLIPIAKGGTNNANNIVISCAVCNLSKGSKLTKDWNGRLF